MKGFRALLLAGLIAAVCFAAALDAPEAGAYTYKKCGTFRYKGKHALFTHRYPCAKAKRKAKYVLRTRHSPPRWKCSLAQLSSGFAACHRGKRAWEFVPR